ncbi:LOW QUALITY PROTEIN: paired box protein Pax-4 isoform X2 [Gallus gallus]|uniref:LOW QUALITY PROTEIN: paired box protein Pax-4 isoform X2 n=1 Tax=Gallus gallus TaxID=9031 RepID=UPI001AEB1043|nr:LOW QUALITY PROTEIN: paired box protein Pax-4 isoform X2 [Gallus gallus]
MRSPRRLSVQQPGPSSINQLGGVYTNGCPLPPCKRHRIIQLAAHGVRSTDISRSLQVSNGCVSKILSRYYRTGSVGPKRLGGWKRRAVPPHVEERIAQLKRERPSVFAWEIRRQLHVEGVGGKGGTPSISSINRVLRGLRGALSPTALPGGGERGSPSPLPLHPSPHHSCRTPDPPKDPPGDPPRDPPGPQQTAQRTVLSQQQCKALEEEFQRGQYPDSSTRRRLAATTQLPDTTIQVWFSNRRAKWRREAMQRMEANGAGSWCEWLLSPPSTTAPISAQAAAPSRLPGSPWKVPP